MINVYVAQNELNAIADFEKDIVVPEKMNIKLEFIDSAPLTARIEYEGEITDISIYVRDELHISGHMALHGTATNGELEVDEGDEGTVKIAYEVAEGVNRLLQKRGMLEKCAELDVDMQGILLEKDLDGNITFEIVKGDERPDLLCTRLFGSPCMMRPYADEDLFSMDDDRMSIEEIEEAANDGDADAMEQLATAYLEGDDVEADPEKACYWFEKSAEAGNAYAMYNLGLMIGKGFGTERDFIKAAEWMQKAADEGDEDAKVSADMFRKLAVDIVKANEGDAQAQADLSRGLMELGGSLYEAGEGNDYIDSIMWAEKAIAQGNPDGYWTLALAYHHGRGVEIDMDKAIEIYQKGADAGSAACQHNLGCEYMSGKYLDENQCKGFELIKAAAEQGYGLAMRDLGRCYECGDGTDRDVKTAFEWFEKALEFVEDPMLEEVVEFAKQINLKGGFKDEEEDETDEEEFTEE